MNDMPPFMQRVEHTIGLKWYLCNACGAQGDPVWHEINMRQDAREHARLCPAKENHGSAHSRTA
jgi:hypothetical protein